MHRSPSSAATKASPRPKAQPEMNSSLLRFSSAPSSLLGEICENFQSVRPETETEPFFPCFVAEQNGGFSSMSSQLIYEAGQEEPVAENSYRAVSFVPGGGSLIRQSSSPAEFLSHLNGDSGYGMMRRMSNSNRNSTVGDFKGQISFSSRQSSLSQISEMASEGISDAGESPDEYTVSSWEGSLLSDNFSARESKRDGDVLGLNQTEFQNGGGLAHQFSLPKSNSEMAAIEKFLHFQDSVPCKIRAKRGCATHPRSIAERVRRTRISERMRKLQDLVPNMDKQTNTADMLDLAVDYIKHLQKQVKSISDVRATCTCLVSKQKPCQNQGS